MLGLGEMVEVVGIFAQIDEAAIAGLSMGQTTERRGRDRLRSILRTIRRASLTILASPEGLAAER